MSDWSIQVFRVVFTLFVECFKFNEDVFLVGHFLKLLKFKCDLLFAEFVKIVIFRFVFVLLVIFDGSKLDMDEYLDLKELLFPFCFDKLLMNEHFIFIFLFDHMFLDE